MAYNLTRTTFIFSLILSSFIIVQNIEIDDHIESNKNKSSKILSRKKRYVSFPEGSSFSAALCLTIGAIGNPNVNFISYALNWGIAYELPNQTWVSHHANPFGDVDAKPRVQRSFREDFYHKIETIIDNMGFNGRECILRILCETSKSMLEGKGTIIKEIFKILFNFPKDVEVNSSTKTKRMTTPSFEYDLATDNGLTGHSCSKLHHKCEIPIFDWTLGFM